MIDRGLYLALHIINFLFGGTAVGFIFICHDKNILIDKTPLSILFLGLGQIINSFIAFTCARNYDYIRVTLTLVDHLAYGITVAVFKSDSGTECHKITNAYSDVDVGINMFSYKYVRHLGGECLSHVNDNGHDDVFNLCISGTIFLGLNILAVAIAVYKMRNKEVYVPVSQIDDRAADV